MSDAPKTDSSVVTEESVVNLGGNLADIQEHLKQEIFKAKIRQENLEKQLAELTRENRHLLARIRGYQTLSQLLEETKRELKQQKQRNADLQRKLDSLNFVEDQVNRNGTETEEPSSNETQNTVDQQLSNAARTVTGTEFLDSYASVNPSAQRSALGPNDSHTSNTTTQNNTDFLKSESQIAESKQFMSDSKEDPKAEIDFPSSTRVSLQSNPNTKDMVSFITSYTQKDENKDFTVPSDKPIKDASGSSGPSFVVLPMSSNDEPSSTVSLWSMPDLTGQLSSPSALSSMDASTLYSGEYASSQVEDSDDDQDEVASQVKSISEALNKICNLSSQSTLAPELARLTAQTLKVEKQLRLKKTMSESLVAEYGKLKKQINLILPEYERQITQSRLENEQLLKRVRKLEHETYELDVPRSRSAESVHKTDDWIQIDNRTLRTDGGTVEQEDRQTAAEFSSTHDVSEAEKHLLAELEKCKERIVQLTEINAKWDEHCKELQNTHDKELSDMRKKTYDDQALLEREAQQAVKGLRKRILSLEEEKLATINKEVKRRERAEREVSILQMVKKDLESRTQVLEAQIGFYRNNPPLSSLQETGGEMDSITALNVQELRSQFRLQRQQISIYQEDFQTERHDREKLVGEIDSLKAQIVRLKQELKAAHEQIRQLALAQEMERTITIPAHHNMTYTINPRDAYTGPQVAAGWQWQQVATKWRCPRCTYDNEPVRRNCELCGAAKPAGSIYGPSAPGSTAAAREARGTLEMDDQLESENLIHRHFAEECDNSSPSTKQSSQHDENVLD